MHCDSDGEVSFSFVSLSSIYFLAVKVKAEPEDYASMKVRESSISYQLLLESWHLRAMPWLLKVKDLRDLLKARGLPHTGNKTDLGRSIKTHIHMYI